VVYTVVSYNECRSPKPGGDARRGQAAAQIALNSVSAVEKMDMMERATAPAWRFVSFADTEVERLPGKTHHWYCKPGMVRDTDLMFVRAFLEPGEAHRFHYHPHMEEILYVLSGTAEQWVESEKRVLRPGDSVYLPAKLIHGTWNIGGDRLEFLAILSPAKSPGPVTIEVGTEEPWKSLRM